jgi:hypothetical protein
MPNFIRANLRLCPSQFKAEKGGTVAAPFFNLHAALPQLTMLGMFDTIKAELTAAADKLDHLRRFL